MEGFGNKRTGERIESCEKWEKKDLTRDLSKSPPSSNMFLAFSEKGQPVKCKKGKSWTEHGIQCFLVINTNFSVEMIQYFTQKGFSGSSFLFQCNVTVMMVMLKSGRNTAICWTYITNHHEEDISGVEVNDLLPFLSLPSRKITARSYSWTT